MRISNLHIFNLANKSMAEANESIFKTQEQISTGKKVISAADDPVAASRIHQLNNNINSIEQFNKNIVLAQNNLEAEEASLDSMNNLIQRIKELAVQAGNTATLSSTEYQAIADEVDVRLTELVSLANTRNANGDYIFSGYKSGAPAFSGDNINGYRFDGDEGKIDIKVDYNTVVTASDSAKNILVDVPSAANTVLTSVNPNNRSNPPVSISIGEIVDQTAYDAFYPEDIVITFNEDSNITPSGKNFTVTEKSTGKIIASNHRYVAGEELIYHGVSIRITGSPASADTGANLAGDQLFIESTNTQDALTTLMRFREVMTDFDDTTTARDRIETVVASTLSNLTYVQESISSVMTSVGARINTLESTKEQHLDTELVSKEILSGLQDVDYAEAASRLSAQTLVLQAAQASFLRISELNLFNRL